MASSAAQRQKALQLLALGGSVAIAVWYNKKARDRKREQQQVAIIAAKQTGASGGKKRRVAVDKAFLERLKVLIPLVLPGVRSKEFGILALHTGFLVARTIVSIYVAKLDGEIVKSIVDKQPRLFAWNVVRWLLLAVPATFINSMIRFLESKLSVAFRTRLVNYVYRLYMEGDTYYRVGNLDSRLPNPDQCLTEDVAQFCTDLAHLYSQLSKPIWDVILMTIQLVMLAKERDRAGGVQRSSWNFIKPGLLATAVVAGTGLILRLCTPNFGGLIAEEARRYGELRAVHSRVITHAEEIAFYRGNKVEESVLFRAYNALVEHTNRLYKTRVPYTMLEQFLMKYVWGATGMIMIALPMFSRPEPVKTVVPASSGNPTTPQPTSFSPSSSSEGAAAASLSSGNSGAEVANRTQDFITARGLLISAADAIERILSSWKEIAELAGRTARVHDMITVFKEVREGKYVKQAVSDSAVEAKKAAIAAGTMPSFPSSPSEASPSPLPSPTEVNGTDSGKKIEQRQQPEEEQKQAAAAAAAEALVRDRSVHFGDAEEEEAEERKKQEAAREAKRKADAAIAQGTGIVIDNAEYIKLEDVPIVTPNGDVLVANPGLTFEIRPGMHLLITGPNGCGKSSLFRMLGGLWPVKGGVMHKPGKGDIFYIPQRPYLTTTTLRDQFIYPDTVEDMRAKGITDADLDRLAEIVYLGYVVKREGGWDAVADWRDVLSGGEKQRVGMARLFYNKPRFAILDECTSAVSIDVEGRMYQYAKDIGITLLTVTHRPSLWKFHTHLLQFDGQGGWKFDLLNTETRMSLQEEKARIEAQLQGVPRLQVRLRELCALLGEESELLVDTRREDGQEESDR